MSDELSPRARAVLEAARRAPASPDAEALERMSKAVMLATGTTVGAAAAGAGAAKATSALGASLTTKLVLVSSLGLLAAGGSVAVWQVTRTPGPDAPRFAAGAVPTAPTSPQQAERGTPASGPEENAVRQGPAGVGEGNGGLDERGAGEGTSASGAAGSSGRDDRAADSNGAQGAAPNARRDDRGGGEGQRSPGVAGGERKGAPGVTGGTGREGGGTDEREGAAAQRSTGDGARTGGRGPAAGAPGSDSAAPAGGTSSGGGTPGSDGTGSAATSDALARELALLSVAKAALEQHRWSVVLETIATHDRDFADGALATEAEVLRILALCEVGGRDGEAFERSSALRKRVKQGPALSRLAGSCVQP